MDGPKAVAYGGMRQSDDDELFPCYEELEVWSDRMDAAAFWIEGVALTAVGFVGILGEKLRDTTDELGYSDTLGTRVSVRCHGTELSL